MYIPQLWAAPLKRQEMSVSEETLGGYRLANLMMTGQTSQVWEVVELASHRHFAMKLLLPEKVAQPQHRRFLLHEAMVGQKLAHPNIIRIITVCRDSKNPYFIMEYFPAGSLKLRLIRKQFDFIKQRTSSILKQTATAMAYMTSSHWIHRDLKPDNILVNSAGDVRVIDFALAQKIEKPSFFSKLFRRKPRTIMGTRSYMSPEQIKGEMLDARSDIYSYGVSAYEITTGHAPFRAGDNLSLFNKILREDPAYPGHANPNLTEEFSDLVMRLMAKKRENRPKDFHEVLMAIRDMQIYKDLPVYKPEDR
jgi:serine/threonine protein kinase